LLDTVAGVSNMHLSPHQGLSSSYTQQNPDLPNVMSSPLMDRGHMSQVSNGSQIVRTRQENRLLMLEGSLGNHFMEEGREDFRGDLTSDTNGNLGGDEVEGRRKTSSNIPIERLLYPQRFQAKSVKPEPQQQKTDFVVASGSKAPPYTTSFPALKSSVLLEIGGVYKHTVPAEGAAPAPLALTLQSSILKPLRVQARLADSALLTHILVDCGLTLHLAALRSFLFLGDGEFGRQLVLSLCHLGGALQKPGEVAAQLHSHLSMGGPAPRMLSPTSLNRVLDCAVAGSQDPLARLLTFNLDLPASHKGLGIPGLSLTYLAPWPVNIVLTQEALAQYSAVLDFMLELRLAATSLELDWVTEKLEGRQGRKGGERKTHRIALMRHEMTNFLRNLAGYVAAQVLEVSWCELQDCLRTKVTCLDDLIHQHERYLHRVLFRCLLNSKAAPVMKIITDIFGTITRFSSLAGQGGEAWEELEKLYRSFSVYSRFLYSVVGKLSARGYQSHLQDLVLRLNFNGFYD